MGQRNIWRRNRKMVIQLVPISIMYIVVWIPNVICFVVPLIFSSPLALELATAILNYVQYVSCLLCPFMCLIGLPEIRDSMKKLVFRSNNVQPLACDPTRIVTHLPRH